MFCVCVFSFFMGSFPTAAQQEFLYQEEPVVGASVLCLEFRASRDSRVLWVLGVGFLVWVLGLLV